MSASYVRQVSNHSSQIFPIVNPCASYARTTFTFSFSKKKIHLCADLVLQDVLEGDGVSSELADTLTELLDGHLVLVEVEAEQGLVVDVGLLLDVQRGGGGGVELLGDGGIGVDELLEQVGLYTRDGLAI